MNDYLSIASAVALGLSLGFFLQRGRFCLGSAFRNIILTRDLTLFRGYLLAVTVALVGANLLQDLGLLVGGRPWVSGILPYTLPRQNLVPLANTLGGLLFGAGMVLAGSCAIGIVFRLGEGQAAAIIAVVGFFFGAAMTTRGVLSPLRQYLGSFSVEIGGLQNPAFWHLFGHGLASKWLSIGVLTIAILAFVLTGSPRFGLNQNRTYAWGLTGLLIGLLTVAGWWVSSWFGGFPRGLTVVTALEELFNALLFSRTYSPHQEFNPLGIFRGTWGAFFILSVPFGAFLSARDRQEFSWKITPVRQFLTIFGGSTLMGIGAVTAGGCTIGHGLTGVSTGALSSIVAVVSMVLGNWAMTYHRYLRPPG